MTVQIEDRLPTIAEFRAIAMSVGWTEHFDWPSTPQSLARSLFGLVATDGAEAVGTARVVGDGVRYFYIQDVMVCPRYADEGVASRLMTHLLEWIEASSSPQAFVGLFASPEAEHLYREFDFSSDDMRGMHKIIER
jgi:GNAT superfamily N-acetyltransferase